MEKNKDEDIFLGLSLKKLKLKELEPDDEMNKLVFAAKNIKKILKALCPNIKFSVKSTSYSMGNNISISWEENEDYGLKGPRQEDLDALEKAFVYYIRDSMTENDEYIKPLLGKYGSVKYVQFYRHDLPPDKIAKIQKEILTETLNAEHLKLKKINRL